MYESLIFIFLIIGLFSSLPKKLNHLSIIFSFIFGFWVSILPSSQNNIINNNIITLLDQNQKPYLNEEYEFLIRSNQNETILVSDLEFRSKRHKDLSPSLNDWRNKNTDVNPLKIVRRYFSEPRSGYSSSLISYDVEVDKNTNRFNANFRMAQKNPKNPSEDLDVEGCIPEERILKQFYQIGSFDPGILRRIPREINLRYARYLSTRERIEYLNEKIDIETLKQAYIKLGKHLQNKDTKIFLGTFGGRKYTDPYNGFYALNLKTKNMMFFKEDPKTNPEKVQRYSLHYYIKLNPMQCTELKITRSLYRSKDINSKYK